MLPLQYLARDFHKKLLIGPLAAAIPGEVKGYAAAKERYGNPDISWQRLVQPSVDMCRSGVEVSESLAYALHQRRVAVMNDPGLR